MKHLELFSGIGGFRRAMDLLSQDGIMDFETIGYSEIDVKAMATYRCNYDTRGELEIGDIVAFTAHEDNIKRIPPFQLLTAGFPCQSFSVMGNQKGFGDTERGQMFFRIVDILKICNPRYVLLENVKNLYRHDGGKTFCRIKQELEQLGYTIFSNVFNTEDFHLPQKRNRVFIFATKEKVSHDFQNEFDGESIKAFFDRKVHCSSALCFGSTTDVLEEHVDRKYFLSEKIKPTILSDGSANFKSHSEINQSIARTLTASMHKMHRACQDNYYSQDFIASRGEVNPANTLTKAQLAQLPIRKLTPEEAFMLQGFPAEFATRAKAAAVSDGALYRQAGNAVSVNTVYAVLSYLISHHLIKE